MDLVRFDPFSMFREFDRFIDRSPAGRAWAPRVDVLDREEDIVIRVDVAGIDPEEIDVTVEDRTLTISGSRELEDATEEQGYHRREILTGSFKRTLVLPAGLEAGEIKASADNGILEIVVPRKPEVLPRKVKIDVTG